MKKGLTVFLVFLCLSAFNGIAMAADLPYRYSTQVKDVFEPYTADEWVVSPDEEGEGDQDVDNAAECDIQGVISCYDQDYLRVDIMLYHNVSFKWDIFYAVKLEYTGMNEYYAYFPYTKELVYMKERNGKIVSTVTLTDDNSDDSAGITDSDAGDNCDVYFIINKADHIQGAKGNKYFLTCQFVSGYYNKDQELKIADDTVPVDLEFVY